MRALGFTKSLETAAHGIGTGATVLADEVTGKKLPCVRGARQDQERRLQKAARGVAENACVVVAGHVCCLQNTAIMPGRLDEEVGRLTDELEPSETVLEPRTSQLSREPETDGGLAESETHRLESELADARAAKEGAENALEAALRQTEKENERKLCSICLAADRQILFLPCRHVCCCQSCASTLQLCPICRTAATQKIDFIMA